MVKTEGDTALREDPPIPERGANDEQPAAPPRPENDEHTTEELVEFLRSRKGNLRQRMMQETIARRLER